MKRAIATGVALLTTLGFAAAVTAQGPTTTARSSVQQDTRFRQSTRPASIDLGNLPSRTNPEKIVTATVVLAADSVSSAKEKADTAKVTFDKLAAQRRATAAQTAITPNLRAAGGSVRASTSTVLNTVTVRAKVKDLKNLAAVPGVAAVHVSRPIARDNGASDAYTGADQVWQSLGLTGTGLTVGVIDDGIDYHHADFGGSGDPADYAADDRTVIEPGSFPTVKVTGGYDFVGDAYDANPDAAGETDIPVPDADPLACGEHGTHVSGTAAGQGVLADGSTFTGPYNATTLADHSFTVAPGSAPEASIKIYKVFGCDGSVNDDILLAAIDRAVADGVQVINMSLGSTWGTATEPIALAIDNATKLGVLSVVSAGNSGPNAYLVGGPSTANTALSVAAADTSSATLPGVAITGDVTLTGQNSNAYDFSTGAISGVTVDIGLGCTAADYAGLAGQIVVTHRGQCDRVARAILGTSAGVAGVIFINNAAGYPPIEGRIPGGTVPFVGLPNTAVIADGSNVTLDAGAPIPNPAFTNFASFTSNGLRQDSAPKPDITAPGVNILSAFVGSGDQGALLSGTSMAAPHTAGIALLVRQAHPTWGPIAVKGALMSTADPSRVGDWNVIRGGTGMVSAPAAVDASTFFSTKNGSNHLAFGFQELKGTYADSRTISLNNTSKKAVTYDLATQLDTLGLTQFSATVSPATVTVSARSARTITVTLRIRDAQNLPDVSVDTGGDQAVVSGLLVATPRGTVAGVHTLRAPLALVPYGLSDIRATAKPGVGVPKGYTGSVALANRGIHYGTYDTYQWIATDAARDNATPGTPDARDVGVQQFPISATDELMVFAVSLNNRFTTAATTEIDVYIDVDRDGIDDFLTVGVDFGLLTSGAPNGDFQSFTIDLATFDIVDLWSAFAPNNGSIAELPVLASAIGASGPVGIRVETGTVVELAAYDVVASGLYDPTSPAVSMGDFDVIDAAGTATLPVSIDPAAAAQQGARGWLVVSVDDAAGAREADRVPLRLPRD